MSMSRFKKTIASICYVVVGGAPAAAAILVATGVGAPIAAALGALTATAAATLHFMDNPKDAKAAAELGTTVKGAIEAVKAARK
jgi:hypothetical protein